MDKLKHVPLNAALSVASAILLVLVFPRFNLTWLAPVAVTPLLVACAREKSWKLRFLYGWAAGFVFWFGVCYWIQYVLEEHGGLGFALSWLTFFLFAILKGLHLAVFAVLAGFLMRKRRAIPATAALWAAMERTPDFFGFHWLDLGNAGVNMPLPMRLAPFVGVFGLSFVFAMLGCAVALVALRRPRLELAWLAVLLPLPFLPALPRRAAGTESVRVVQPNIDTEADFTDASFTALERSMALLSRSAGVPLIVWPEAPAPFYPGNAAFGAFLRTVTRDSNAFLLLGGVAYAAQGQPLNSAFLISPEGNLVDRYDKINLVPFGEYVPEPFGWVNRITKEIGDFAPGTRVVTFPVSGHKLGAFICYESAFPELVRQFVQNGADALVNLSNDGYFGRTAARDQHLEIVRMRAAENRRWILRATNDGITAVIDPAGRVAQRLPPYQELAATMQYSYVAEQTPYTRYGDWFAWGCLAVALIAMI